MPPQPVFFMGLRRNTDYVMRLLAALMLFQGKQIPFVGYGSEVEY
jgi:hypothetical protein